MNIKKLSILAGVSPATVSKAFNGAKDIGEETKQKIFAIAKQYNCFEKYNKVKYPKKVVAVICPEVESEFYILGIIPRAANYIKIVFFKLLRCSPNFIMTRILPVCNYYGFIYK